MVGIARFLGIMCCFVQEDIILVYWICVAVTLTLNKLYITNSIDDSQLQTAGFVRLLVMIRDHMLELSGEVDSSRDELAHLVEVVCAY